MFEKVVKDALVKLRIDPKEKRMQAKKEIHLKQKRYQSLEIAADGGFDTRVIFSCCKKLDIKPNI